MANKDLSAELAFSLGAAGAELLCRDASRKGLAVGRDTRASCDMLEAALTAGICAVGADTLRAGVMPTPGVAYLVKHMGLAGGVVISASHNPADHNGIKFFGPDGFKLADEREDEIAAHTDRFTRVEPSDIGRVHKISDAVKQYVEHLMSTIEGDLAGLRVAIDCANGAAFRAAPLVFQRLGAIVSVCHAEPDGHNINLDCGSTHPEAIQAFVRQGSFDVGFAHDGDADRVIAVDENGDLVDGDFVMAILASHMKERGRLTGDLVVSTVMANLGFSAAMEKFGIEVARTRVGDRYVLEEMLRSGSVLGGEQSGHIIFAQHATTGDGIMTALQLARVMREERKPLSELKSVMTRYPQVLTNVVVSSKLGLADSAKIWAAVRKAEDRLGERGRVLVRPSGTEPLVRVMVECEDEEEAHSTAGCLADIIKAELGTT